MSLWFAISLIRKRNDVSDVAWGLGFVRGRNKRIVRPQSLADFFSGDELTRMLQQQRKNPKWLLLPANPPPCLSEFAFLEINLEGSKANNRPTGLWSLMYGAGERHECICGKF